MKIDKATYVMAPDTKNTRFPNDDAPRAPSTALDQADGPFDGARQRSSLGKEQVVARNATHAESALPLVTSGAPSAAAKRPTHHRHPGDSLPSAAAGRSAQGSAEDSGECEVTTATDNMAPQADSVSSYPPIPEADDFDMGQESSTVPQFERAFHSHPPPPMVDQQRMPRATPFGTPQRSEFIDTGPATSYQPSPSHSDKKHKTSRSGFVPIAPARRSTDVFTSSGQRPKSPGLFGSQARGIRGGRPMSLSQVPAMQLPPPSPDVIAQLQQIPDMLSGGMSHLTQMVGHLAQKVNGLESRMVELESENRALKAQNTTSSTSSMGGAVGLPVGVVGVPKQLQQQNESFGENSERLPPLTRKKDSIPLPGEPYGGPLYMPTPRGPGMLGDIFGSTRQPQRPSRPFDGTESTNGGGFGN
ncbi:hypothetical protein CBER1_05551 [Cercospora berteroae]|uniref:Uncharacterized protein n=1 Tax=Cercospora berteroae TaxID=357750 RepID=A0A2S6BSF9_9PEZI|nr:hypothetical protein CBER1_05551 [Cercospora berteroae]